MKFHLAHRRHLKPIAASWKQDIIIVTKTSRGLREVHRVAFNVKERKLNG